MSQNLLTPTPRAILVSFWFLWGRWGPCFLNFRFIIPTLLQLHHQRMHATGPPLGTYETTAFSTFETKLSSKGIREFGIEFQPIGLHTTTKRHLVAS